MAQQSRQPAPFPINQSHPIQFRCWLPFRGIVGAARQGRFSHRGADLGSCFLLLGIYFMSLLQLSTSSKLGGLANSSAFQCFVECGEWAGCANSAYSLKINSTKVLRQNNIPGSLQWQYWLAGWYCKPWLYPSSECCLLAGRGSVLWTAKWVRKDKMMFWFFLTVSWNNLTSVCWSTL